MRHLLVLAILGLASPLAAQLAPNWAKTPSARPAGIRIIIRGDDFGYTHASVAAMRSAARDGILTSASLIPVAPWFPAAIAAARAHPRLSTGLHLALNSEWYPLRWGPVLPEEQVRSLVAPDGFLFQNFWVADLQRRRARHAAEGRSIVDPLVTDRTPVVAEVEAELRAQVALAQRHGMRIDYLDCHMGAACLPPLRSALIEIASDLCLPIPEQGWMGYTDVGIKVTTDAATTIANLRALLESLDDGLHRLVVHPAVDSEELRAVDTFDGTDEALKRQAVLSALVAPEIREVVRTRQIVLVPIRELWDYQSCRLK